MAGSAGWMVACGLAVITNGVNMLNSLAGLSRRLLSGLDGLWALRVAPTSSRFAY